MYYPQSDWEIKSGYASRPLPDAQTYIAYDESGNEREIEYHSYICRGPYSMPGPAKSQVTAAAQSRWSPSHNDYIVYAEVEESTGAWNTKPKGVK